MIPRLGALAPWLLLAVGAALFVRAAWLVSYSPSMDYAVVVDMAHNMAAGSDFPVFFYGQDYMGSLEPSVSALLCRLFGQHPFWVCMGTALFGVACLCAVMLAARRLGGNAGASAALVFALFGGPYWVHFMVSPRGGYALATFLSVFALSAAAIARVEGADGRVGRLRAAALGFAGGLAFWNFWLALPAFAAAGVVILSRLRLKTFSPRFLVPAVAGFSIGSAPWWLWVLRHGFGATVAGEAGPAPMGVSAVKGLLAVVVPEFFGFGKRPFRIADLSLFWKSPFPWVLAAIAAFAVAEAAFGGSRARQRQIAVSALYAAFFLVAYSCSSFGSTMSARYLVPFAPAFAIVAGAAVGSAMSRGLRWRVPALALFALYAAFVAPRAARGTVALVEKIRSIGVERTSALRRAADDPALASPAFADFSLFGANWSTGRRLCFVSPLRWRYTPYLRLLEAADSPAVVNGFLRFGEFCRAAGGTCRSRDVEGFSVADSIVPPPEMLGVDPAAIASMRTSDGEDVLGDLADDDLATGPSLEKDATPAIDVVFSEPQTLSGVFAIVVFSHGCYGWRADAIGEDGTATTLSRCNPYCGWFWSGPRPYLFGPDSRWELRWPPQEVRRLRLTFEGTLDGRIGDGFCVMPVAVKFLSNEQLPPLDVDVVSGAVARFAGEMPGAKIHAGRWLARQLGGEPDPSLTFGRIGDSLAIRDVCRHSAIGDGNGDIAVLRGDAAVAAEATLRDCGADFSKVDAGGATVFAIRSVKVGMHYYGGRIMRDTPSPDAEALARNAGVADFGSAFRLLGVTGLREGARPGESFDIALAVQGLDDCDPKKGIEVFVHGVRDGKLLFQNFALMECTLLGIPANAPRPARLCIGVSVPPGTPPGPVTLELCARWMGKRMRLKPEGDGIETDRRRLVLGKIEIR